jgi:hypothetical protein
VKYIKQPPNSAQNIILKPVEYSFARTEQTLGDAKARKFSKNWSSEGEVTNRTVNEP